MNIRTSGTLHNGPKVKRGDVIKSGNGHTGTICKFEGADALVVRHDRLGWLEHYRTAEELVEGLDMEPFGHDTTFWWVDPKAPGVTLIRPVKRGGKLKPQPTPEQRLVDGARVMVTEVDGVDVADGVAVGMSGYIRGDTSTNIVECRLDEISEPLFLYKNQLVPVTLIDGPELRDPNTVNRASFRGKNITPKRGDRFKILTVDAHDIGGGLKAGMLGTVVDHGAFNLYRVHLDDEIGILALFDDQIGPIEETAEQPEATEPIVPTAPMARKVLNMLKAKGSLTSLEAGGVLKCRDLPKRISELRKMGWPIEREFRTDPSDGQRYARYHLQLA